MAEKVADIHEIFDPEGAQEVFASDELLRGFMAPGALADDVLAQGAPAAAVLAADCRNGQAVNSWRREDFNIVATGPETRIHGYVKYKRVSCRWWEVKEVKLWMINEPIKRVWAQGFKYSKVWFPGNFLDEWKWGSCAEMRYGSVTTIPVNWQIQARGRANVEVIDEHHLLGDYSCVTGGGTTYNADKKRSAGFRLPGGTR